MKRRPVVLQAALIAVCAIVLAVTANSASATTADLTARVLTINFGADSDKHVTIRRDYGDLIVVSGVAPGVPGEMIFPAPDVDTIRVIAADPAGSGNDIYVNGTTTALTVGQSIDNQTGFELALSGSITTTAGGITSVGPVSITGDTTLTTAGDSVFESTVSGTGTGGKSLTIAGSTGSVTFKGNVTNLASYTSAIPTVFGGTGAVSMTSIGSQTFTGGITNAAGHAATTLTASSISSAGTITSAAASTLTLTATNDITIAGQITGAIRIVKAGSNTLTIARANTTTGGFGINAGTVVVSHGSALGTGPITAAPDTTLTLSGGIDLTGPTGLTLTGSATASTILNSTGGANTLTVPITSSDPSTLLLAGTSDITLAGQLSGKVRISKPTTGTLTLSQSSTSNGGLALSAGTVVVSHGSALGTGPISMLPDTTLTLSGGIELTGPSGLTVSGSTGVTPVIRSIGGTNRLSVPITLSSATGIDLGKAGDTSPLELNGALTGSGVATTGQYVTLKGDATVSILQPISAVKSFIASAPTSLSANVNAETETFTGTVSLGADVTLTTAKLDGAGNIINGTLATKTLTIDCRNYIIFSTFTPPYTGLIGGPSGGTAAQKDINLVLTGNSRLMLGGGNTYTGTTTISGSEVTAYAATSLSTGAVTVNGTGTLSLRSNIGLTGVPSISLSGPGRGNGRGALHAVFFMGAPGDVVVTQTITLAGDATISGSFDANLIINGGITGASHVLSTTGWTKLHSPVTGLSGLTNTADAYETWLDRSITTTGAMSFTRTVYLENSLTLTATGLTGTAEFLNATGSSKTLTISTSGDSEFQGQFATPSATDAKRTLNLVKSGAGRLTLAVSSSAPIGTATISNGSLLVSGSLVPTAGLTVSPGTTLFGSGGNLGGIVLGTNGLSPPTTGSLDLGRNATPQRINATGFTGTSTGALLLELDGPDVTYSQLTVSGTVDLADTMLYATVGATPQPGDRYTIIDNTGVSAINGTFLGVSEGDRVVLDTHQFIVSYTGGDGNDVTLTYFGAAPTITASAPATGLPAGGTEVTITGTGFGPGAIVTIGGVPCTGVAVASNHTSLTCTTGAHAVGAATITVTNIDGQTGTLLNGYTFADPPPPPAPAPTPTATPTASPTTAPVIAKPSFNASGGSVSVVVNATGLGTATLRVVASGRLRVATGCTAKKAVKTAGRVTLSCKLPAAVRSAIKRAAVKLTVTTTWAPKSGTPTRTVAAITAKR